MNYLFRFLQSTLFWWAIFILPMISILIALYFQYALDEGPCALCIHIRIYMAGLMIVGLVGALLNFSSLRLALHWICAALCTGLAFKCWELFGVEKGFIDGSCTISAGLPAWFALESWFPLLFESWGLCGVTPEVIFGISMAEALMPTAIAAAFFTLSAAIVISYVMIKSRLDGTRSR